jgi:succinoglycan biosynthesis protein ExoM
MANPPEALSCTIAVLTYLRPDDLRELLPELIAQADTVQDAVEIVVIDNDPEASARALVEGFASNAVRYGHEPTPGIAAARNRALALGAQSDILIFIDDDERPGEQWLARLIELYRERRPAAVVGPVVSRFSEELDPWIVAGGFFTRKRFETGSSVAVAATNNLLLDMAVIRRLDLTFDATFGISGGSDTLFSRQLTSAGEQILWHDDAIVLDVVPPKRQTREWVLQRAYRSGNSWSRTSLALQRTPASRLVARARLSGAALFRIAGGAGAVAAGTVAHRVSVEARGRRAMKRGAGMLSGAFGNQYQEYRRPVATN